MKKWGCIGIALLALLLAGLWLGLGAFGGGAAADDGDSGDVVCASFEATTSDSSDSSDAGTLGSLDEDELESSSQNPASSMAYTGEMDAASPGSKVGGRQGPGAAGMANSGRGRADGNRYPRHRY